MTIDVRHIHFPSSSGKILALGTLSLAAVYSAWKILAFLIRPLFSPFRDLPGPKNPSWLLGYVPQIFKAEPGKLEEKWVDESGPTFTYNLLFNFMTLDTKALSHILKNSYDWQKPPEISASLAQLLGEGLLFAEGDSHKRQRRIISAQLRDIWLTRSTEKGGSYKTDVLAWLNKATLDIIGLVGFDYEFNALTPNGEDNELSSAFMTIYKQTQNITTFEIMQAIIPPLRPIPTKRSRNVARVRKVMDRVGRQLIDDKRRLSSPQLASITRADLGTTKIEKSNITTRDLLSRLMTANMATDLPESQRFSDKDVFAQIPTFLIAGHETTSTATAWCLYALARDPEVQTKLREELLCIKSSMPSMEELNSLSYLDAVVRETCRLHPAVAATVRMATKDDIIPLGSPVKNKHGEMVHEIRFNKGENIIIPIISLNTYKGIWGDDANEFKPERWMHLPEKTSEIPGVWGSLLTFIGGPRSCIGYRFALLEMKCLIWTLVRGFTFEFIDPAHRDGISKKSDVVTYPVLTSEAEKGRQLPLKLTPWRHA